MYFPNSNSPLTQINIWLDLHAHSPLSMPSTQKGKLSLEKNAIICMVCYTQCLTFSENLLDMFSNRILRRKPTVKTKQNQNQMAQAIQILELIRQGY